MKKWFAILLLFAMLCATVPVNAQNTDPYRHQVARQHAILFDQTIPVGTAEYWNTRDNFVVEIMLQDGWVVTEAQLYAGEEPPALNRGGQPVPGQFTCVRKFATKKQSTLIFCSLDEEIGFTWGGNRTIYIALHGQMVQAGQGSKVKALNSKSFWALPVNDEDVIQKYFTWPKLKWGGYFTTILYHPQRGHFIDSPVSGITYRTPTNWGTTDEFGGFDYFPGERVDLWLGPVYLGNPIADQKTSPLDIFENADITDLRVVNMARLLQSLDADGSPKAGINITYGATACLSTAMMEMDIDEVDFSDGFLVDDLINATIAQCAGNPEVTLVAVSAEEAIANLDDSLNSNMFRKNISKTPELSSSKSKLDLMTVWFPARRANGELTVIEYSDQDGNLIRTATEAKPVVVTYTDSVAETGYEDIFAAISRDDGNTFKRTNLSRAADKSSFTLENGLPYYGAAKKPVVQVKGNNILVAWTSKYCNGGRPAYAISLEDDYLYDDPYYTEDIWGVGGPQRSVDYAEQDFPEVGEIPYSCVWAARGTIVTQAMINKGGFWANYVVGDIVWFKPERLTSGRRDALQIFAGGADGAGFAIVWQEDPEGLMPGSAVGPGAGWSGATTNHKTDIWYSYITTADFYKVDENFVPGGDPVHEDPDIIGRPKALVPMSLPVRLSDNDVVNSDNLMATTTDFETWTPIPNPNTDGDGDGTHAYGYKVEGLCEAFYEKVNEQGELKQVCVTADNRLLDGDTGASRPNLNLQTYTVKGDDPRTPAVETEYKSAWAIVAYEETKGAGGGAPDHEEGGGPYGDDYVAEEGKNAIYHSFDFRNPDVVSAGNIINLPERDAEGNLLYLVDETGAQILDWRGLPQLAYENARRPRFIMQGKSGIGATRTIMVILYKEGVEGQGRPSDIMMRRVVVPSTDKSTDNPYRFTNFACSETMVALNGQTVCVAGAPNLSTVTPTVTTESQGDPQVEDPYGAVKVVQWIQTPDNLDDASWVNPYEDARAHRGDINGDFLVVGYTYTPNWAAYRNGNDKYDFYVRRSYDGGQTWTTDPNGAGVTHCDTFTDPVTKEKTEICNTYGPGEFEQARNVSQLPNNKQSVIEPRIVAPPGTIKNPDGTPTGKPEDINNPTVYYLSFGTANNVPTDLDDDEGEYATPADLYYSFTIDLGESYVEVAWEVNPDSDGNYAGETVYRWDFLAKGDPEQGEAQLRMTPDGSRFYATWLQEGLDGSDIWFRRVMSPVFPANVAAP